MNKGHKVRDRTVLEIGRVGIQSKKCKQGIEQNLFVLSSEMNQNMVPV